MSLRKSLIFTPGVQYLLPGVAYEILEVLNEENILVQTVMPPQQKGIHQASWLRQHWCDGTLQYVIPQETHCQESEKEHLCPSQSPSDPASSTF